MSQPQKDPSTTRHRVFTIVGIVLCALLIPLLIVNVTLIIKSYTNPEEVPKLGGYAPMIVLSPSMEPSIKKGDLIFVKTIDASEVQVDDVITFFDAELGDGKITTHKVIEKYEENGTLYFRTKGDNNNSADRLPVPAGDLVGIYTGFRLPGMGSVAMFMQTTAGLIVCVFVPLVLLVGWDIFRRRRHEKNNQQDTEALLAELEALKAEKAAKAAEQTAEQSAEKESAEESDSQ